MQMDKQRKSRIPGGGGGGEEMGSKLGLCWVMLEEAFTEL